MSLSCHKYIMKTYYSKLKNQFGSALSLFQVISYSCKLSQGNLFSSPRMIWKLSWTENGNSIIRNTITAQSVVVAKWRVSSGPSVTCRTPESSPPPHNRWPIIPLSPCATITPYYPLRQILCLQKHQRWKLYVAQSVRQILVFTARNEVSKYMQFD